MTNEAAKAVINPTRLIPCDVWPLPREVELVEELAELVLDAVAETVDDIANF